MFSKNFLALAVLQLSVPVISVLFFGASFVWLLGGLIFAIAMIRALHETGSVYIVTFLCLLSGVAFAFNLMLGSSYYMLGEGFNDSFFYHLNSGSLVIAARTYGSVFYPSLLGLLLSLLTPAIIYKRQSQTIWPAVPVVLLWVLALTANYPIYSLASYQFSSAVEVDAPGLEGIDYPELSNKQAPIDVSETKSGSEKTDVSEQVDKQAKVQENHPKVIDKPIESLTVVPVPNSEEPVVPAEVEVNVQPETTANPLVKPNIRKNIILIYAESLEAIYFDKEIFGELLPNLRHLSEKAHRFTNLKQVGGTGWTVAGIVASQCGFGVKVSSHLASNSTMASVEKPYPNETCLADILSADGYATVYMGGAPLWFAGKKNFLHTHGYQRISGDEELAALLADKKYQSGWGLYDDSLFDLALNELQSLEQLTQPYLLTLLTLDTHHPGGIPSKSCKKLSDNQDSMSNAIFCSDQLISKFIDKAMQVVDMNNTVIVLFSDHLSLRNTLWDKLRDNRENRKLTLMVFDDAAATVSDIPGTHFDVAPTLLEAAGFTDQPEIGAGVSLFSAALKEPGGKQVVQKAAVTPALLSSSTSVKESGVALSRRNLSLSMGGIMLKANNSGQKFESGMYMAVLDDERNVVDAIYADDYEYLAKTLNGTFVIGVSLMAGPPYSAVYFYGNISPDRKGITQRDFNHDVYLSAIDLFGSED